MQLDKEKRELFREMDKQYFKPHFGPEETEEMVQREAARVAEQKAYVR